jgi:hypothetical protein
MMGHLWNGSHQDHGDKGEYFVGPNTALHNCFCSISKEALSKIKRKKGGRREEEKREKRDGMPQWASHPCLCKISY